MIDSVCGPPIFDIVGQNPFLNEYFDSTALCQTKFYLPGYIKTRIMRYL